MNKIRRVAEQLVDRYPTLFSTDFEKNKQALATVSIVHTRSLRNQLAGAITKLVREKGPISTAETGESTPPGESLLEERLNAERRESGEAAVAASNETNEPVPQESSDRNARTTQSGDGTKQETISQAAAA